jgi:hypothetical protein
MIKFGKSEKTGVYDFHRFREGSRDELKYEDLKIHERLKHGEGK